MAPRLELSILLNSLLGSSNVYFQPPPNTKMLYPAIVYERDSIDSESANNRPYTQAKRYQVTVIDRNPDSLIPDKIASLPMSSFSRHFVTDNLNHDVFNIYF